MATLAVARLTYLRKSQQEEGLDPRRIDPLLVRLAGRDLLLYRSYSRGVTLKTGPELAKGANLRAIEQGFFDRNGLRTSLSTISSTA